ncbi:SYF2-domain-containing protein [Polychaeton citri CBS 116435]|uniref:Pre-mRNA-splicing factor SYF2 n=1 Tax=Polychaeton citri CBS 116435 TaxID=1314669 RepID=A0A9P4UU29_9PEZI|nr:SYF2-domain-containing protein [Polychaeton citri CBS 116435]
MPVTLKRKGSPSLDDGDESSKRRFAEQEVVPQSDEAAPPLTTEAQSIDEKPASSDLPLSNPNDRLARFSALRARNKASREENLKETKNETRRLATDPSQLTSLSRKRDVAQHKLLKVETEEAGEDFERKRAWDWTIEESERWDERQAEKQQRRDKVAFRDYRDEAGKVYDRQVREMDKGDAKGEGGLADRKSAYEREKAGAIERAIKSGGLEIVETDTGELIAVDKDGSLFSTADSTSNFQNRPDRAAVDRLVADIRKAEEVRLKKRRERGKLDEDSQDVTYINEKNKQFNQKLARFYNKYTADIRESFERGTAI